MAGGTPLFPYEIWVYASAGIAGDTYARELVDGSTVVQIEEDDGSISPYAIDGRRARFVSMIEDLLVKARNVELAGILAGAPKVSV